MPECRYNKTTHHRQSKNFVYPTPFRVTRQLLLAAQQGAHVGQGGRPQPMPEQERAALLDHAKHNKPEKMPEPFTAAPEDDDAADSLAAFVIKLLRRLLASHYYLIEREADAMIWLGSQFKGTAGTAVWMFISTPVV